MRIKKEYKPTFHRSNARYRGVTDKSQYTNFILETVRDLLHLSHITTGNEATDTKGHEKEIMENFLSIMTGDHEVGRSNIFTASTLRKVDKDRELNIPALTSWSSLNECEVKMSGDSYILESPGLKSDVGMYTTIFAEPGDSIYIRLKVRSDEGAADFSFGSNNMRTGPTSNGDTKKVPILKNKDYVIVDHVIRFKYAESVSININVHQEPDALGSGTIQVKDVEIYYINESDMEISPYHTDVKPNLSRIEDEIRAIR